MQTRSTLDTSSNNLFTNIERLGTRDLLFYGQLSYDTILTSIQKQTIIASSSIISSSDNILIELVEELYTRTKQSSTLPYEALLLLRPLSLLLAHISFFFRALINARYSAKVNEWTLLSMTNIAQRKSLCMAIWELTCLMLSACLSQGVAVDEDKTYNDIHTHTIL
ncbi:unnamed protein product [Rotaria sp. Silwood1]|nr:unnamed protein product [Rotaria sp. Silwood1]CAF1654807.1 unnamed protein product [Rotaria sp. Silwood1]